MRKRMINTWPTRLSTASLCFSLFLLLSPASVQAADLYLNRFDDVIQVNADGSFDVTETILADFAVPKHGIYRVIPTHYRTDSGATLVTTIDNVSVTDLGGKPIETNASNGDALSLRIGSAEATVNGPQYYVLHYRVHGALVDLADQTELYWNVTGTDWDTPPSEASVHVQLPAEATFAQEDVSLACYTGAAGSTASDCTTAFSGRTMLAGTSNDFLTIAFAWPKGLVTVPPPTYQSAEFQALQAIGKYVIWVLPLLTLLFMFWRWHRYGRDPKGRGTIVPEYEPPKGLLAAEMGILFGMGVRKEFFSAAIVELAVRGHLKIIERTEDRFGPDRKTFTLEKVSGGGELREWETLLLNALFKNGRTSTTEDDLKNQFAKDKRPAEKALEERLVSEGYFAANPSRARAAWMGLGIVVAFLGFPSFSLAVMLTGGIILLFGWLMAKRTKKGAEAFDVAKGFKVFLTTAEKYRLEWQEKEGIFEKYLPYAMIFGIADKWAKAFATVHAEAIHPAWYIGPSLMNFNAADFSSRMNDLTSHLATVAAPKSGASHGGGFSGGGFGGGGGGSW